MSTLVVSIAAVDVAAVVGTADDVVAVVAGASLVVGGEPEVPVAPGGKVVVTVVVTAAVVGAGLSAQAADTIVRPAASATLQALSDMLRG
jgi:hypothetical protein